MLLLIGAVIGITAFADEAPSVEIVRKNISYDGAVKTLYALDAKNVGNGKVGVLFYSVDPADESAEYDYVKYASEKITLGKAEYDVVFSKGFRPTDLRKSIFAVPVIVEGNKVVAKGAAVEYSPYIYAMNRFDQESTADQLALYTALLEYGAAVQRVLSTPAEVAANGGYADEYYSITVKNALATALDEKTDSVCATFSKADVEAGKVAVDAKLGDTDFVALANADGNPLKLDASITTTLVKPGSSSFVALYGTWDEVRVEKSDFTNGNPNGFIETSHMIKTTPSTTRASFPSNTPEAWKGNSSLTDNTGALVHTKVITPLEVFDGDVQKHADYNYQFWRAWFTSYATLEDISITEFDVKFSNYTGSGSFNVEITGAPKVSIKASEEKDENGYIKYFTLGNAVLENDKTYNIRLEWFTDAGVLTVYVDDVVALVTNPIAANASRAFFNYFGFETGAYLEGVTTVDNLYLATACIHSEYGANYTSKSCIVLGSPNTFYKSCTECKIAGTETFTYTGTHTGGKYYNSTVAGTRYDMSTAPSSLTTNNAATFAYEAKDGVLSIKNIGYATNIIRVLDSAGNASSNNVLPGTKFVAEFDIRYDGCDLESTEERDYQFMGIAQKNSGGSGACSWSGTNFNYPDKHYAYLWSKSVNAAFAPNVWYNFRYEYYLNVDGTANFKMYVDDAFVTSGTLNVTPTVIYGFAFESRGNSIDVGYSMDNMFLGVDDFTCEGEHTFGQYTGNAAAYNGAGGFYESCGKCGIANTESELLTVAENVTLGNGTYYANSKIDGYRWDYSGTGFWLGTDANKGIFTGYGGALNKYNIDTTNGYISAQYEDYTNGIWSTASLRPVYLQNFSGVDVAAGDKIVSEFDFIVRDGVNLSDNIFVKLSLSAVAAGSDKNQFTPQFELIAQPDGITHKLGSATLYEGVWYSVRMECTVGGEYALYVNDVVAASGTYTTAPAAYKFYGPSVITRGHKVDISFDNQFAAINPVEAE